LEPEKHEEMCCKPAPIFSGIGAFVIFSKMKTFIRLTPVPVYVGERRMPGDIESILIAAIVSWVLFITIDILFGLPKHGGVSGAREIAAAIEKGGGEIHGGYMMGNIVCSPDASAGTLLAACGVYIAGIPGGLAAAVLVYIGNRICYDPGYAGTTGALAATFVIYGFTLLGFSAAHFIAGMVIAILTIQGISHLHASRLISHIWRWRL